MHDIAQSNPLHNRLRFRGHQYYEQKGWPHRNHPFINVLACLLISVVLWINVMGVGRVPPHGILLGAKSTTTLMARCYSAYLVFTFKPYNASRWPFPVHSPSSVQVEQVYSGSVTGIHFKEKEGTL